MRYLVFDTAEAAKENLDRLNKTLGYPNPFNNAMTYTQVRLHTRNESALLIVEDRVYRDHKSIFTNYRRSFLRIDHEAYPTAV